MQQIVQLRPAEIGALLAAARRDAGLSQQALADRIGTTQSAVSRWERGHDEPRWSTLSTILAACGRRAELTVRDDVDLAQIRDHLALAPADRLRAVANVSRFRSVARRVP